MSELDFAAIPRTRVAAVAFLLTAIAVSLLSSSEDPTRWPSMPATPLYGVPVPAPPTEVTPEIVAIRGCAEGVAHPSEARLDAPAQLAACNDWVKLSYGDTQARLFRGLFLLDHATSDSERQTAFADMTAVIWATPEDPKPYAVRALIHAMHRNDLRAAMADIDRAIALEGDDPHPLLYEFRATFQLQIADQNDDPDMVRAALEDARRALTLAPDSKVVPEIEGLARQMFEAFTGGEMGEFPGEAPTGDETGGAPPETGGAPPD